MEADKSNTHTLYLTRQLSIAIYGAKVWNSLDENLKSSVTS